eukprot:gnl/TRDRNA2_/TRDRNA2_153147_c0_seq3.p1 gnl/TRDRNA2_/TRDRNA2_153147_c0~~gnl/TRDRNA2_/TRDRNA2_153147_c0_seq3.p1  ORF type:complete len:563 (+),score=81.76 gnl/TRDRNA2_/TRDRNA2_153147_c0_seq3:106-1794(+)
MLKCQKAEEADAVDTLIGLDEGAATDAIIKILKSRPELASAVVRHAVPDGTHPPAKAARASVCVDVGLAECCKRTACGSSAKAAFMVTCYLIVGVVFYCGVEEKPCESKERLQAPDYDAETCTEPWAVVDALYFSMVTMSTVGYGDYSPGTPESKLFTCFYIIIGVAVVFVQLCDALSGVMEHLEDKVLSCFKKLMCAKRYGKRQVGLDLDIDGDGQVDCAAPPDAFHFWFSHLTFPSVVLVLFQITAAFIFTVCQQDLLFGDAFYHCMVTATTVGYGDVSLSTRASRLWAVIHIALSVAWLAALISKVSHTFTVRTNQLHRFALLQKQLDTEMIQALDKDGQGVDILEFVIGMLMQLGVELCGEPLQWADVRPFVNQFEAADLDGSTRLGKEDLAIMVSQRQEQIERKRTELIKRKSSGRLSGMLLRTFTEDLPSLPKSGADDPVPKVCSNPVGSRSSQCGTNKVSPTPSDEAKLPACDSCPGRPQAAAPTVPLDHAEAKAMDDTHHGGFHESVEELEDTRNDSARPNRWRSRNSRRGATALTTNGPSQEKVDVKPSTLLT